MMSSLSAMSGNARVVYPAIGEYPSFQRRNMATAAV